jgi:hypothetical protein
MTRSVGVEFRPKPAALCVLEERGGNGDIL